ncbi:hypothetical protein AB0J82_05125 [Asanoa sp. NPDC049518]|uniref:hypothetical protein n=1 Tax=unclassified Asanoa TaxID=2685164 RepID=UPI0034358845
MSSRRLRRRQRLVLSPPAPRVGVARRSFRLPVGSSALAFPLGIGVPAVVGYVLGGVVAAVALGAYGAVAVLFVRRRRVAAAGRAARSASLDRLTGLAADLRAGLPANSAFAEESPGDDGLITLARSAVTLASHTGAPLADLVDRIEADARAGDRARAAAAAQAAGAQATAVLLAALPLGGLMLGYAIGSDPLAVLLHTPLGALCALGAVGLQILGLAWSQRLQPRLS